MLKAGEALEVRKLKSPALYHNANLSKVAVLLVIVAFSFYPWKPERCS